MKLRLQIITLLMAFVIVGCTSLHEKPPMQMNALSSSECPSVVVDHVVILTDSSDSMREPEKFPTLKSLLQSFIMAMPSGDYNTSINLFAHRSSRVISEFGPFNRGSLLSDAEYLPLEGGLTPMRKGFEMANQQLSGRSGTIKVIIFSDGKATDASRALEFADILANSHSDIEFHAVQTGLSDRGLLLLQQITRLTSGGTVRNQTNVNTPATMREFVQEVFCGEAMIQPTPTPTPPPAQPMDSDGDGVYDEDDECPDTPRGAKVDERGCWTIGNVLFDYDKATIRPEFENLLVEVAEVMKQNPDLEFRIDGHTDSIASEQYNQALSERRANSVYDFLVKSGVSSDRLRTKGFGESMPVAPNDTPENRQLNRRVEFTTIELD